MKLDPEIVRDLLLALEEDLPFSGSVDLFTIFENERLINHDKKGIYYAGIILMNEDYVIGSPYKPYGIIFRRLTGSGHQFLDEIRHPKVWNKTKETMSELPSVSLQFMAMAAKESFKKYMGFGE